MWLILAKGLPVALLQRVMEATPPPPLIPTINALTLQDFKHDCRTIGMFSNTAIPSEKLSKRCPTHLPPSRCKTCVQIYLFSAGDGNFQTSFSMRRRVDDGSRAKETLEMQKYKLTHVCLSSPIWPDQLFTPTFVIDRFPVGAFFDQFSKYIANFLHQKY